MELTIANTTGPEVFKNREDGDTATELEDILITNQYHPIVHAESMGLEMSRRLNPGSNSNDLIDNSGEEAAAKRR